MDFVESRKHSCPRRWCRLCDSRATVDICFVGAHCRYALVDTAAWWARFAARGGASPSVTQFSVVSISWPNNNNNNEEEKTNRITNHRLALVVCRNKTTRNESSTLFMARYSLSLADCPQSIRFHFDACVNARPFPERQEGDMLQWLDRHPWHSLIVVSHVLRLVVPGQTY